MTDPEPELFPVLDPPPGGLHRLRARINHADHGRHRRRATAALCVVAAVALGWIALRPAPWVESSIGDGDAAAVLLEGVEHPALVGWGRAAPPDEPVVVVAGGSKATRMSTHTTGVVMYRLEN